MTNRLPSAGDGRNKKGNKMKKIMMLIAAMALSLGLVAIAAGSASATGGDRPGGDNKKVTICHYKGDNGAEAGKYAKTEVDANGWYNGHKDHSRDIWEAFSYTTKSGEVVNVPAQGDTSLLQFENCEQPKTNEKVDKPEPTYVDKCGLEDDVDLAVAPGTGYTVGDLQKDGNKQTIVVTLNDGFEWKDGSTDPLTFTHTFTNETDCDLPETGLSAAYNTPAGYAALGAIALIGTGLVMNTRRRRSNA